MQRLKMELHNPRKEPENNHYLSPNNNLKEVLKHLHESAVAWAHAAYNSDTVHEGHEDYYGEKLVQN